MEQLFPNFYQFRLGVVNSYFIDHGKLTLIDTGVPGSTKTILDGIAELGKSPGDVERILVTHFHADHTGSLIELKEATGATTFMSKKEAELLANGVAWKEKFVVGPGSANEEFAKMVLPFVEANPTQPAFQIDEILTPGQVFQVGGGLEVISTAGHTVEHVSFLFNDHGGIFIAGDCCASIAGLNYSPLYEDFEEGAKSLRQVAERQFDVAVFGHGDGIMKDASQAFETVFS